MKSRILLLLDEPIKGCNKLWLLNGLIDSGIETKVFSMPFQIFKMEQKGRMGKLFARICILLQAAVAIICTRSNDIIFCWNHWTGVYTNLMGQPFSKKIISYNWLTPSENKFTGKLLNRALNNRNLWAITNSKKNKDLLIKRFNIENQTNLIYIPDVFDDQSDMVNSKGYPEDKYIFMGGISNRDWKLFLTVAKLYPDLKFIGVASKVEWDSTLNIPENVSVMFDVSDRAYYSLMESAYLILVLLKEDKVAGLINILKAIQLGKVVISTKIDATDQYYSEKHKNFLIDFGNEEKLYREIKIVFNYSLEEYTDRVEELQEFIINHFSPQYAMTRIIEIINDINSRS